MNMKIKKGNNIELEITDMAIGGRGIAKIDGMVVFVNGAVNGDKVIARILKKKKDYAEAKVVDVISKSECRISPVCQYNQWCGGCKWQFIEYKRQLYYKEQFVKNALKHISNIDNIQLNPIIESKDIFEYRNKMEFSCSDKRWLLPEEMNNNVDQNFACGLHVPGTFHKVIDINSCLLQPDIGNKILCDLKKIMKDSDFPAYGLKSHEGFWRFCVLRNSSFYKTWMINIVTSRESSNIFRTLVEEITSKYPCIETIVNNITSSKAGVALGQKEIIYYGKGYLKEKLGNYIFEISANSFFQTNTHQAEYLYNTVEKLANLNGDEFILDLYSGTGTIPIWLSQKCKKVIGIELIESAVNCAKKNCMINNINNCDFIIGDINECLSQISDLPDILIIDPPRDGMHKNVLKQIFNMDINKIIYVSCNPATLARDILKLKEKYIINEIQPVDMFPNTFHIETVVSLEKK